LATLLGGICIIGLWWAYFDRLDDDAVRKVSTGGSARLYTLWLYLHLPLTVALTMVGAGLTLAIEGVDRATVPNAVQWLFMGSVAGYFLAEAGISLTTLKAGPSHPSFVRGVWVRFGLAAALLLIRLNASLDTLTLLGITALLITCLILSDHFSPDPPDSVERVEAEGNEKPTAP
jgi:low temperature requirement protein LtrA